MIIRYFIFIIFLYEIEERTAPEVTVIPIIIVERPIVTIEIPRIIGIILSRRHKFITNNMPTNL